VDSLRELALALAEARDPGALRELQKRVGRVEAEPPSKGRERALAWLFYALARRRLAEGRVREAEAALLNAVSYARTGADSEAYRAARELEESLAESRSAGPGRRRKHRR
jgi:hypothetical protein